MVMMIGLCLSQWSIIIDCVKFQFSLSGSLGTNQLVTKHTCQESRPLVVGGSGKMDHKGPDVKRIPALDSYATLISLNLSCDFHQTSEFALFHHSVVTQL